MFHSGMRLSVTVVVERLRPSSSNSWQYVSGHVPGGL